MRIFLTIRLYVGNRPGGLWPLWCHRPPVEVAETVTPGRPPHTCSQSPISALLKDRTCRWPAVKSLPNQVSLKPGKSFSCTTFPVGCIFGTVDLDPLLFSCRLTSRLVKRESLASREKLLVSHPPLERFLFVSDPPLEHPSCLLFVV